MVYLLITLFIYFVPTLWVNYTLGKHDDELPNMPFTGSEFGNQVLKEKEITNVSILGDDKIGDHYDVINKKVGVKSQRLNRKSLTSITVVCHEIGHAIQDKEKYKPLILRQSLIEKTMIFQRIGSFLLIIGLPSIFAFTKSPFITLIAAIIIMGCLSTNVLIHLITLPVEFDASFKRALPILKRFVPRENMYQCKSVLRAAALTYLAQSIVSIFRLKIILLSFINIFKSIIRR